jgi:P-type Ca2+ transporter type 2C
VTSDKGSTTSQHPSHWWAVPYKELLDVLKVDPAQGLSAARVEQNRARFGTNSLEGQGPTSLWVLLLDSIKSPMLLVLLSIAIISLILGQAREAIVMVVVVAIYVGVHLLNKARSDRTMAELRKVQATQTMVVRDGKRKQVDFSEVVVGDILPLRPGTKIPADGRVIAAAGLLLNEGALTGESAPVSKEAHSDEVTKDTPLADRKTAVFAGTTVLDGQGKALVIAVGDQTELGQVAALSAQPASEPTPLQQEMDDLATILAYVAVGVSLLIPLVGLLLGFDFEQMVLTWLSLTFLMVPGQPPIIIAMALAIASLELAKKGVIVRRLYGAETLGSINVVLSDKTGTMTENKMALSGILLPDGTWVEIQNLAKGDDAKMAAFLTYALAAIPETSNDPTDTSIQNAAYQLEGFTFSQPGVLKDIKGFSKDGTYRRLTYQQDGDEMQRLTGRPEYLSERSDRHLIMKNGQEQVIPLEDAQKKDFINKLHTFAEQGKTADRLCLPGRRA